MTTTTELALNAPTGIATLEDANKGVEFLRIVNQFYKEVDQANAESISLAHKSHKAALKVAQDLKKPLEADAAKVRLMLEAYAENRSAELPEGVFRRDVYTVVVTDPSKVPAHFLIPDTKALADYAKRTDGAVKIPGCEILKDVAVTVRAE